MFEDWKQAWRQAVENFQREAAGESGAPPRLRAMERELASAAGALRKLDDEIRRTQRELSAEQAEEQVCRRRERLAIDVADEETARIAAEYAVRHAERAAVLERKATVLEDERSLLARDMEQMRGMLESLGPASAGLGDLADGAPPAAPTVDDDAHDHVFSRLERDARERAADERLEELKRRMRG